VLSAYSQAEIADRWGALKRRAAKIGDEIEALKQEFERRELLSAKGLKFTIVKSVRAFASLDVKAIRAEMGAAWCAERERESERTTYEVNPIPKG
jgi:hypothetical protein